MKIQKTCQKKKISVFRFNVEINENIRLTILLLFASSFSFLCNECSHFIHFYNFGRLLAGYSA